MTIKGLMVHHVRNDTCKKNHHNNGRKAAPLHSNLSPTVPTFTSRGIPPEVENCSIQRRDNEEVRDDKAFSGFAQRRRSSSEPAMETLTTYLPCWTLAQI